MKKYQKNTNKKQWCIELIETRKDCIEVIAVDKATGEDVASLIRFDSNGDVKSTKGAKGAIEANGYDPAEHRNKWGVDGQLIVGI